MSAHFKNQDVIDLLARYCGERVNHFMMQYPTSAKAIPKAGVNIMLRIDHWPLRDTTKVLAWLSTGNDDSVKFAEHKISDPDDADFIRKVTGMIDLFLEAPKDE